MKPQNNCPSCGAAIVDEKCPYCGILFYDFATMELDKPFYIKFKKDSRVYRAKVLMNGVSMNIHADDSYSYADNSVCYSSRATYQDMTLDLTVIPENGVMLMIVDTDEVSPDARPW